MAIKINLEKYGIIKNGFIGFSYTTYFFNAFVPIFRADVKGFLILLAIWIATKLPINIIGYLPIDWENNTIITNIFKSLLEMKIKYILIIFILTITIIYSISSLIWIFVGRWYNKFYTKRLLNEGYYPAENDNYAFALLKGYGYLDYTEEDRKDNEKIELYRNIITTIKKEERTKLYMFLGYFIFIIVISIIVTYVFILAITNYLDDMTLIEFLQKTKN